jgi:hypothetical protein
VVQTISRALWYVAFFTEPPALGTVLISAAAHVGAAGRLRSTLSMGFFWIHTASSDFQKVKELEKNVPVLVICGPSFRAKSVNPRKLC